MAFRIFATGFAAGFAAGCGSSAGVGYLGTADTPGADVGSPTSGSTGTGTGTGGVSPGVLTAGIWDDNLNYDFFRPYEAAQAGMAGDPGFTPADYDAAHAAVAQRAPHMVVDAALVLDTTGSMGDELSYLTTEFANMSGAISAAFPDAAQRWALVVYRDTPDHDPDDEYVVRTFDFTSSVSGFTSTLGQQSASGGGDYPESPELGLSALNQLSWRSGTSVARLAFWVGDAPHHADRGAAMNQAIAGARAAGIHLYPVSASGTNDLLEFTMRTAAQITGGRYLFLTDDSGIGDPHKVPEIPCYYVTKLQQAIVRAVAAELTSVYTGPDPAQIIRIVGSPTPSGQCTTADNQKVQIY
jgi:hypothetical protein